MRVSATNMDHIDQYGPKSTDTEQYSPADEFFSSDADGVPVLRVERELSALDLLKQPRLR